MRKREAKKILTPEEAALAKAMFLYTDKNNQQILSYFIRPGNDINGRVMTQLRKNEIHSDIPPASKNDMESFIKQRENIFSSSSASFSTKDSVILYQPPGKSIEISVKVDASNNTVWLTQSEMACLFNKDFNTINEHIQNIYNECELDPASTSRNFREVRKEGSRTVSRAVFQYNLDVIISVGYRVKSYQGTQFRIWANRVLKQYLLDGYALNQKRLSEERNKRLQKLQQAIGVVRRGLENQAESLDEAKELLRVLSDFSEGLKLLDDFDNKTLDTIGKTEKVAVVLTPSDFLTVVEKMKPEFCSDVFANPKDDSFESSVNQIYQTFGEQDCYPSLEEKAATLLYLITKNHSFTDGNKRIAAGCFLYFLERNGILYSNNVPVIDNAALAALTLLIAESRPQEMETIKQIVVSVLNRNKGIGV